MTTPGRGFRYRLRAADRSTVTTAPGTRGSSSFLTRAEAANPGPPSAASVVINRGRVINVTPETAGWTYVGFELHKLAIRESVAAATGDREACLVLVSGQANVTAAGTHFGLIGERMTPFEGRPDSVYVPGGSDWRVEAATDVTLAVCSAPSTGGALPARRIGPEQVGQEVRGKGTNVRYVTNILPESEPADS